MVWLKNYIQHVSTKLNFLKIANVKLPRHLREVLKKTQPIKNVILRKN
jgi:hypothetical protein